MKKLAILAAVFFVAIILSPKALAQYSGENGTWVRCIDPNGYESTCFRPYTTSQRPVVIVKQKIRQNIYVTPGYQNQYQPSGYYDNREDGSATETQTMTSVRRGCTLGRSQYYGLPYWQCTYETERVTLRSSSTNRSYRPTWQVYQRGRYGGY